MEIKEDEVEEVIVIVPATIPRCWCIVRNGCEYLWEDFIWRSYPDAVTNNAYYPSKEAAQRVKDRYKPSQNGKK